MGILALLPVSHHWAVSALFAEASNTVEPDKHQYLQQAFVRKLMRVKFNLYCLCVTVTTAHGVICGIGLAASCVTHSS